MIISYAGAGQAAQRRMRASALLAQYPDLSEKELAALIGDFQQLTPQQKNLMSANEKLAPKLADFDRDHGGKRTAPTSALVFLLALPPIIAGLILVWVLT